MDVQDFFDDRNISQVIELTAKLHHSDFVVTCIIVWQPRRATDTSMNWRQSLFCCCTANMEQAADGAETAAIDGLVSSWSENISVSFCLRAPGYGLTLWCALDLLVGAQYKCLSYSTVTITCRPICSQNRVRNMHSTLYKRKRDMAGRISY